MKILQKIGKWIAAPAGFGLGLVYNHFIGCHGS